jgi:catechol 2,3-dioxygenase-like lactoylglutathione lyase family enzyme
VPEPAPNAFELFNAAIDALSRGDLAGAVRHLREGFFENLYIAPLLIGEECHPQRIWHPGPESETPAAGEYVARYGRLWEAQPGALAALKSLWHDSLVRAELKGFINLSKKILNAPSESVRSELLRERVLFQSAERIKRTQTEIVGRLARTEARISAGARPRLALVLLAAKDPAASVEFYRQLLGVEPRTTSGMAGGYAEFEFEGVHLAIHGQNRAAPDDPYALGPPPAAFGWGSIFVFRVPAFDRYYENAVATGAPILDGDLTTLGRRSFVVKDPSGYLLEITEEEPKGFETL